jgi:hypothetical protein
MRYNNPNPPKGRILTHFLRIKASLYIPSFAGGILGRLKAKTVHPLICRGYSGDPDAGAGAERVKNRI